MKRVTIKDVAKAAGVSCATVSRAFSGSQEIGKDTKKKIIEISEKMGYSPSAVARSMVRKKTETVGIIVPSIQNPYMGEFTSHLEERLRSKGYGIMVCSSGYDLNNEHETFQMLISKQVDGVFIMPGSAETYKSLFPLIESVPTVFIGENIQDFPETYVSIDNYNGARQATEYLYSLGHRKILYFGSRKNSLTHERRLAGYMDVCKNYNIKPDVLKSNFQRSSQQVGYVLAKHLFEKPLQCTAIFCASDNLAIGVMQAADEKGIKIPNDISIIGFDNISFSNLPRISLTTIDHSLGSLANAAIDLMMNKINNGDVSYEHRILMPTLVERTSCRMID